MDISTQGWSFGAPWFALMLALAGSPQSDDKRSTAALERYRNMTTTTAECAPSKDEEITICARRPSEYRLDRTIDSRSFTNSKDDVRSERADLLKDQSKSGCGMAATLSGCGSAGVTVRVGM